MESAPTCDYFEGTSFSALCSVSAGYELTLAECIERRERSLRQCKILEWTCRKTLAQKERELGKRHSDTLASMSSLALVLSGQGNHAAAECLHRETLNLRELVLGEEHSLTLASRNNLALALSGQEKYAEAEQVHRDTLRRRVRAFGQHHLATLISLHNLAQTLSHQGRYTAALPLYRQAHTGCCALLGPDDPITQACYDHFTSVQQAAYLGTGSPKKKQYKKSKALNLVKPALDDWAGARWWPPRLFKEARHRERARKETVHAEELEKASVKEHRAANKLYNDNIKEQKREAAAAAKVICSRERAKERAAIDACRLQRQKDEEARDAQEASQLPNKGKHKASTTPKTPAAKKRRVVAPCRGAVAPSPPPPARTHTTRSGRAATQN
jgi:tetratricopeptide (TPR) repeat protein